MFLFNHSTQEIELGRQEFKSIRDSTESLVPFRKHETLPQKKMLKNMTVI